MSGKTKFFQIFFALSALPQPTLPPNASSGKLSSKFKTDCILSQISRLCSVAGNPSAFYVFVSSALFGG